MGRCNATSGRVAYATMADEWEGTTGAMAAVSAGRNASDDRAGDRVPSDGGHLRRAATGWDRAAAAGPIVGRDCGAVEAADLDGEPRSRSPRRAASVSGRVGRPARVAARGAAQAVPLGHAAAITRPGRRAAGRQVVAATDQRLALRDLPR